MYVISKLSCLILILFWILNPVFSQSFGHNFLLETLSIEQGLSNNIVRDIYQDRKGFIWICTQDGLNRYDGYSFRTFSHDPNDPTSISGNVINTILEDQDGFFWIGTFRDGLCRFDPKTEVFQTFKHNPDDSTSINGNRVRVIFQDDEGTIWVGNNGGLDKIIMKDSSIIFRHYSHDLKNPSSILEGEINSLEQDVNGKLWIGGNNNGFCRMNADSENPNDAEFLRFNPPPDKPKNWAGGTINDFISDKSGNLWVATWMGLAKINREELAKDSIKMMQTYSSNYFFESRRNGGNIPQLTLGADGTLWAANGYALFEYLPEEDTFLPHTLEDGGIVSKGFNMILGVMSDRNGELWMRTMEGVVKTKGANNPFFSYTFPKSAENNSFGTKVREVTEDSWGQVWVGMESGGMWIFDEKRKPYKHIVHESGNPNTLGGDFVMSIYEDKKGQIWVGTYGGGTDRLTITRSSNGRVERVSFQHYSPFYHGKGDDKNPTQYDIYGYDFLEDENANFWMAGYYGLYRYETAKDSFFRYPVYVVNHILEASNGVIWISTDLGPYYWDSKGDSLVKKNFDNSLLDEQRIFMVAEDLEGQFWAGTDQGLFVFHPNEDSIRKVFTTIDGLSNSAISSVERDNQGQIWLSHQRGLSVFDPETDVFTNYYVENGILNPAFTSNSSFKNKEGRLFWGGDNGVIAFNPDSFQISKNPPSVVVTEFRLFDKPVPVGKPDPSIKVHDFFLPQSISETETLTLAHNQNILSFEFAALDFAIPSQNAYAFQLEGFDQNWRFTDASHRMATYTNLDPGTYRFRVKAANADGVWNEEGTGFSLIILPPWWKTWWAYLIYVLILGTLIYGIIRYRIDKLQREMRTQARIQNARAEEREEVRARSSRDFHDETGNKITKISLYTGLSKRKAESDPELIGFLEKIEENVKALSTGMRDFIWALDAKNDHLIKTITRLKDFGQSLFEDSGIEFKFRHNIPDSDETSLEMNVRRNLLLIFKEAMNNSLKYAQCNTVKLEAEWVDNELTLTLSDDGLGFEKGELMRINGLNNMKVRAEETGGTLEISSIPGLGTTIRFEQPIENE